MLNEPHDLLRTAAALALVFTAGVGSYPLLRLPRRLRIVALSVLAIPVFLARC